MIKGPDALCRSYGQAMLDKDGKAIAGHYVFPYYSFTLGQVHCFDDRATANDACSDQVARFERAGVGSDIRMREFEVVQVSDGSALCHITWEVFPVNGMAGWSWTNVYGYRRRGDEEGFEFNISDNEIGELLQRFPDFYNL
ncbi:hypothetical protein MB02_16900 [Croceicoccus estronivorus]|uniref:hypothetical protein n=1 Tax=Croceicoccus estronivorus TaxID=1172626 RepID=UPI000836F2EE|nr:hypothetical protein [Croceicoccus estronivorus]OCC22438.1 hypothetical protein MB02_16900 [Croceicoccus estronivorus]